MGYIFITNDTVISVNGLPLANMGQFEHQKKKMIKITIQLIKIIYASRMIFKEERKEAMGK